MSTAKRGRVGVSEWSALGKGRTQAGRLCRRICAAWLCGAAVVGSAVLIAGVVGIGGCVPASSKAGVGIEPVGAVQDGAGPAGPGKEGPGQGAMTPGQEVVRSRTGARSQANPTVRVSIHPLTRAGTDSMGKPALLLHLETLDAHDQVVKAFGVVRVELVSSRGGVGDSDGGGRVWQVDLRDGDANALMFDALVTRTYTLALGGVPEWFVVWGKGQGGNGGRGEAGAGGAGGGGSESNGPMVRVSMEVDGRTLRTSARLAR